MKKLTQKEHEQFIQDEAKLLAEGIAAINDNDIIWVAKQTNAYPSAEAYFASRASNISRTPFGIKKVGNAKNGGLEILRAITKNNVDPDHIGSWTASTPRIKGKQ